MGKRLVGLLGITQLLKRQPLIEPGLGIGVVALQGFVEIVERRLCIAGLQVGKAATVVGCRDLRRDADGPCEIDDGLLMVTKPKLPFPASIFLRNYHIMDLNFYYMNVRRNAQLRAEAYFREAP